MFCILPVVRFLGARFGWPQANIAAASLLEIALQVLLPTALAAFALVAFGRLAMLNDLGEWLVVAILLALAGLTIAAFGRHFRRLLPRLLKPLASLQVARPVELLPAGLWYLLFFFGMSFLAWTLYTLLLGYIQPRDLPILAAAFLISWVMGFVVPGAPGGIGVREGSFAVLGGVFLNTDLLVLVALLMRLVTLLGEGVLFLLALYVARRAGHLNTAPAARTEAPSGRPRLVGEAAPPLAPSQRLRPVNLAQTGRPHSHRPATPSRSGPAPRGSWRTGRSGRGPAPPG